MPTGPDRGAQPNRIAPPDPSARPNPSAPPDRIAPPGWQPSGPGGADRPWVIYDGQCAFCRRCARALAGWDHAGTLQLMSSADERVARELDWIPVPAFGEGLQFVASDGRNWQGAAAVECIVQHLARDGALWRSLAFTLRVPGARTLLRIGYDTFARHRCRFGCG